MGEETKEEKRWRSVCSLQKESRFDKLSTTKEAGFDKLRGESRTCRYNIRYMRDISKEHGMPAL